MKKDLLYDREEKLLLEESCRPPLQAGAYRVSVQEEADHLGAGTETEKEFWIDGPRFSLPEGEVISVYPPAGLCGDFGGTLPQIVFGRRTLLWEREIQGEKQGRCQGDVPEGVCGPLKDQPWLALLTLYQEEKGELQSGKAKEVIAPPAGVFFPKTTLWEGEEEEICTYIELDTVFFHQVMPEPEELALLCHGRQVESGDSPLRAELLEDWVSVLAGNRLPGAALEGKPNHVYLISLEGFGDYRKISPEKYQKVRLLVLYHWEFVCTARDKTLLEYLKALRCKPFCPSGEKGDELLMPNGYFPMEHHMRNGAHTVSLYRGPLLPVEKEKEGRVVFDSDGLYRYDPETGIFDVTDRKSVV